MAAEIYITNSNLWIYGIIVLLSGFFLFRGKIEFNREMLTEYVIFLTTKIILFIIFISFLTITCLEMVGTSSSLIINFIREIVYALSFYSMFNYSIFYFIKFIGWCKEYFKNNDLMSYSLLKEVKEK